MAHRVQSSSTILRSYFLSGVGFVRVPPAVPSLQVVAAHESQLGMLGSERSNATPENPGNSRKLPET